MYPHRIRLRGPWQCEPLDRAVKHADGHFEMVPQELPPSCQMTMPCRWSDGGLGDFAGRVRFRRRFGRPRQLDPHEAVWLTFAGVDTIALVTLNGCFLGRQERASEPFEFEVTELLRERNELVVEVEAVSGNGGLWGEVALEVRASAFLRGVRARCECAEGTVRLHIRGEAVGTCDRLLEIYVLLDRSTIAYRTIQPTPAGQAFDITHEARGTDLGRTGNREVRIELVYGAVIWYAVTCTLE
jgi:hypothetical protein